MNHQMELPEERLLGEERGAGQDVTIILVPKGGSRDQILALIHLHSHVLSTRSKYFNTCLSERWKTQSASPTSSTEFVLEVHTDVEVYFECFSNMYSPSVKTFKGVKQGVELLKVASQIDYPELMERISLYLSTMLWSEEDEIRVREYSSSPDFPRIHLEDLVERLGLHESEEDCQRQFYDLIRQWICAALYGTDIESYRHRSFFTELLQGFGLGAPSNFAKTVVNIVIKEAKDMFVNIGKAWSGKSPTLTDVEMSTTVQRVYAMCWILEVSLKAQVAEDLVRGFVHIHVIPDRISTLPGWGQSGRALPRAQAAMQKLAGLVLVMYQEVAVGRLLLRSPERMALLLNWHSFVESTLNVGSFEQATKNLFSTLPLKQQMELITLQKKSFYDYMSTSCLMSMLSKSSRSGRELGPNSFESETVNTVLISRRDRSLGFT